MTNEQIEQRREEVKKILQNLKNRANNVWLVCCIWESPMTGGLDHREGFFIDYIEARWFAQMLEDTYGPKKFNFTHEVYFFRTNS